MLIDPNGMEVIEVNGGYKYTEGDIAGILGFLQSRKKNVYLALMPDDELTKSTNSTDYESGQWFVRGVKSAKQASFEMAFKFGFKSKSLNNMVFQGHGGIFNYGKGDNFFLTSADKNDRESAVTANRIDSYVNDCVIDEDVAAVESLMGYVRDNGNFVFQTCNTMAGTKGDRMLQSLLSLSGNRLNIYGTDMLCSFPLGLKNPTTGEWIKNRGIKIEGSISLKNNLSWKGIRASDSQIMHFSDIRISTTEGTVPLQLKK